MNAPRLTSKVLDDLVEAIVTLDADIDYLEKAIPQYGEKSIVRKKLVDRYNKLIRARNWINGKMVTEREKREPGEGT